ncbi:UDP-3-O-(3-hydroxymyristoyl)glucosamine N-acyltransferase [Deferribacterales bacterium RsTz2092]|nr:UDP-3-O-acylglucosamine N-acyltransferase [Deferribacterales bacterium]
MTRLDTLAAGIGAELVPASAGAVQVATLSLPEEQKSDSICALNKVSMLAQTAGVAAAYIVPLDFPATDKPLLKAKNPRLAMTLAIDILHPAKPLIGDVSKLASVADSAKVSASARVDDFAVVGEGSVVGDGAHICSGVIVGANVVIGKGCKLYPHVVIYDNTVMGDGVIIHAGAVIGADGFGFEFTGANHRKITHIGNVVIGNGVEIGANSAIDRAVIGSTVIAAGTKIDNMVHIGHNVQIGKNCLLCAQVGIAGSTVVGDFVTMGGQCGVGDHANVESGTQLAAKTGVMKHLSKGVYGGLPARPINEWLKQTALIGQLGDMKRELSAIRNSIGEK